MRPPNGMGRTAAFLAYGKLRKKTGQRAQKRFGMWCASEEGARTARFLWNDFQQKIEETTYKSI